MNGWTFFFYLNSKLQRVSQKTPSAVLNFGVFIALCQRIIKNLRARLIFGTRNYFCTITSAMKGQTSNNSG